MSLVNNPLNAKAPEDLVKRRCRHHEPRSDALMRCHHIPVFARFQWINSAQVVLTLSRLLKPEARGREGYGKTLLFRWLMWKWLMR